MTAYLAIPANVMTFLGLPFLFIMLIFIKFPSLPIVTMQLSLIGFLSLPGLFVVIVMARRLSARSLR